MRAQRFLDHPRIDRRCRLAKARLHKAGSTLLPIVPYIEAKERPEKEWPSWSTAHDRQIKYGKECCPKTLGIWDRYVEIYMDPKYSDQGVNDLIAAIRKVYSGVVRS